MTKMEDLFEKIEQFGIIPVIAIDSVDGAVELADALIEGGLPLAEITFRTAAAADVIATLQRERPNLLLGAGTVLTQENLQRAKDCGAKFAVAPGLNPVMVSKASEMQMPFVPGVVTPGEIEQALALGCKILKFFPSEASGGMNMIKALAAPYAHTGVRFVPTGGVTIDNLESYLSLSSVAAVGGTWIATKENIAQGKWEEISQKCRSACEIINRIKGK